MCSAAMLFRVFGVPSRAEDLVGMAACATVVFEPCVVSTVSFQLSYGAVCGLVRFGPSMNRIRTWKGAFLASLRTSVAATAGTLPALAWWFQDLSAFGLLVNVWALPWVATVVAPLAFVSAMGLPRVSGLSGHLGTQASELLLLSLKPFDVEPLHPAVGSFGALVLAAILVSRLPAPASGVLALLVLCLRVVPL